MMKRIKLHFFMVLMMTLLALTATAHDFEVNGIYYNINGNEATVTYKGTSYSNSDYSGSVNIPATVTYNGTTYSVTTIGADAFFICSRLTSVTIPNSVTTIGSYAFYGCSKLSSVTIPNSVTTIASYAFFYCSGLTNVTIPNSVTTIGYRTFSGCSVLTSISVESGNPNYDSRNYCNAIIETATNTLIAGCLSTTIPNSVTTISYGAFDGCDGLTSITIPNSVTTIGDRAFCNCSGLTNVSIPNSVTNIGSYSFCNCSGLINVTIPNSVTTIGYSAFSGCSGLTCATCLATTPPTISNNVDYAFYSEVTDQATLYVPEESVSAYQTAYNWKDFYQIVGITVTPAIDDFEVDGVWYRAIDENTAMVIQKPDEDELYSGDVVIPEEVTYEDYTFTVTAIDEGAFEDCYELNSVVIGDAVENIGENAFQGCTGLTSVTIGSGVTNIGAKAFNYCNALQTVTCRGTVPPVMASSNCFTNATYSRAILKVPRPEIETYTATDYWYKFSNIEGWGYLGPGDVNGSGTIDMDDLTRLINIMLTDDLGGIDPSWADVTGNGIVSMNDLTELINLLLTQ